MGYITPKQNWNAADYFNIDPDWNRIYNNARLASGLAAIMLDTPIAFTSITTPTISKNPTEILAIINTLLANIENTRLAMIAELPLLDEIKDDWIAGKDNHPPDFNEANQWENTIDAIWNYWNGNSLPVCPTLAADLTIPPGTQYGVIECINPGNFEIIIEGTGELFVI